MKIKSESDIDKYKKRLIKDFRRNDRFELLRTSSVSILLEPFELVHKGRKQIFQMEIKLVQLTNEE